MGTIDSIWKNVKIGMLGVGTLVLMGNSAIAQENKKINVRDLPSIRPEWTSMTYFYEESVVKGYDIDRDGKEDFRFVYPALPIPHTPGILYGLPTIFGYDRNKKKGFESEEMYEIDYSNSQEKLDLDKSLSKKLSV